ncbi:MAG: methyl-accepting chemotaxis protein [Lachnospiraceae bacterium]|nr:methyl-accepting chemotaxis protein [Lachnospiraceae bacterium]MCI7595000.1 methyl-accepting chemotaxis protein [Lachnospiraceae bacterium]MDY3223619.1 methyl-accepting chemotaxis protein [Lachnospiraceae bacterium]
MKSIKGIFLSLTFAIIVVLVGSLSWTSYRYSKSSILNNVEKELKDNAILIQTQLDAWLEVRMTEITTMADTPILQSGEMRAINTYLGNQLEQLDAYSSFWVSDLNGDWYSPLGTTGSISERDYFPVILSTKEPVISNPLIGKSDGKLVVVIAVPVKVNGQMKAILGANVKVEELVGLVGAVEVGETGYATLYQADGTVIADRDTSKILESNPFRDNTSSLYQTESDILSGTLGIKLIEEEKGTAYVAHTPMNSTDWIITVVANIDEFMAPLEDYLATSLITAAVLLIVAAGIVLLVTIKLTNPIRKLQDAAVSMAEGDCTVQIKIKDRTEIGRLADAFAAMGENLQQLLAHILGSANQIDAFSEEIDQQVKVTMDKADEASCAIKNVTREIRKQVDFVDKMAGSAGEISSAIVHANVSIEEISASAEETVKAAKNGNEVIASVKQQMEQIKEVVSRAAEVIEEVGTRSKEIGEIVDTIASISSQTNLLALNASIEAARAGEQGRGFAVVAQEVGKLAEESGEATKKIAHLVTEMQQSTEKAVSSMEAGTIEVTHGTEVVSDADTSFRKIQGLIEQLMLQLEAIMQDMQNIGRENEGLVDAVEHINTLSREILNETQVVEEASDQQLNANRENMASVERLARMSEKLILEVKRFKID